MSPIKVVHVRSRWLAQTETWLYEQVKHLPPTIESHVLCNFTWNLDQFNLPRLHSLSNHRTIDGFSDAVLRKLRLRSKPASLARLARRTGASIAHSHFGNTGWRNMEMVLRARMKHIVTFYGMDVTHLPQEDPAWIDRYRELFGTVERVLCEGPHMAMKIRQLGCPDDKVHVHHLGAKVDKIDYSPLPWDGSGPLRVLIVAAFREKKGIPYAMEALARLKQKRPVKITIIGDASQQARSQAEKAKIMAVIDAHKMHDDVLMLGMQPHHVMFEQAKKHHILLSPSVTAADGDTEGGAPVSIIEMMAAGMLIVSSRHCDIPHVCPDGEIALLADEKDVSGLTDRLTWLADHPERWDAMRLAGRMRIEQEFDCRVQGNRLAEIYREVQSSGAANGNGVRQTVLS